MQEINYQAKLAGTGYIFSLTNSETKYKKYFKNEESLVEYLVDNNNIYFDQYNSIINSIIISLKDFSYLLLYLTDELQTVITVNKIEKD